MDLGCPLFLCNNRQHMSVCTQMISSCVTKFLSITKVYMSLGTVQSAAALVAGVSFMFIL